jgi:hypothetical protein
MTLNLPLIAAACAAFLPHAGWAQASFETSTSILTVPSIKVGSATYRDLKARLDPDGRLTILSLTPPSPVPASFSSCQAPVGLSAGSFQPRAAFQSLTQMRDVLSGTWVGCDVDGRAISITLSGLTATGTVGRVSNYYGTYNYCTYTLDSWMPLMETGQWDWNVKSLTCAEGDGRDQAHGNVFSLYAKGGPGYATELLLELSFRPFARVVRQ